MINSFQGEYSFLSNFYPCIVKCNLGLVYPSVENAYQASKSDDLVVREHFVGITAGQAKRLGRALAAPTTWPDIKVAIMSNLLEQKFSDPTLAELLLSTGDSMLIEGNYWGDRFWGVCQGKGLNKLGELLMGIRLSLINQR